MHIGVSSTLSWISMSALPYESLPILIHSQLFHWSDLGIAELVDVVPHIIPELSTQRGSLRISGQFSVSQLRTRLLYGHLVVTKFSVSSWWIIVDHQNTICLTKIFPFCVTPLSMWRHR
jgi:hypothetical protein